jgi:hypothetical protein
VAIHLIVRSGALHANPIAGVARNRKKESNANIEHPTLNIQHRKSK